MSHDEKTCINCAPIGTVAPRSGDGSAEAKDCPHAPPCDPELGECDPIRQPLRSGEAPPVEGYPDCGVCKGTGVHPMSGPCDSCAWRRWFGKEKEAGNVRSPEEVAANRRTRDEYLADVESQILHAFMAAVHDGRPCPFCDAKTTNVHPWATHLSGCAVDLIEADRGPRPNEATPTPTSTGEIDPRDPYWHGRPLWVIYGPKCHPTFICAKLRAYDAAHIIQPVGRPGANVCIWGYSVYRRVPGFRTMGTGIETLDDPHFFSVQDEALSYLRKLTTPMGNAARIG